MLKHHKVPTIFNIYMLDVICCALGCVILLWQVAHREAETQTEDALKQKRKYEKAHADLLSASSDLTQVQIALGNWQKKHHDVSNMLVAVTKERDAANVLAMDRLVALDKSQAAIVLRDDEIKKLRDNLEQLLASHKKTTAELTGIVKLNADLLARLALAQERIEAQKTEIAKAGEKAKGQAAKLTASQEDVRKLQMQLVTLQADHKDAQEKLKVAQLESLMRQQELDIARKELAALKDNTAKDLVEAKTQIAALKSDRDAWKQKFSAATRDAALDKETLAKRIAALQAEAEQRFAGIPLTGENVIFLIDISGSMAMKDENTDDPDKWPFLCETLMKLMKSIPTLQRFQVILFSDKVHYLFGNREKWYKYDGPESAQMTRDALRKIKVEGGTNMHDGFEEAFRYRKAKLDTIYLFSDGLPNLGEGLPANLKNATEAQRSYALSKIVRDKLKNEWNRPQEGVKEVRVNAVGFFFESPDVGAFLWALAREHRGAFVGLR
jgi:hypothetical protein